MTRQKTKLQRNSQKQRKDFSLFRKERLTGACPELAPWGRGGTQEQEMESLLWDIQVKWTSNSRWKKKAAIRQISTGASAEYLGQ